MTLKEQLKELADGSIKRHPEKAQVIMRDAIQQLKNTTIIEQALKTGDVIPEIRLSNATGEILSLIHI